ncbi:hypothetical protein V5O48_016209, partial [Marasmius crinis-equi]
GLTFSLIIVRVGSGASPHETTRGSTLRFGGRAQGTVDELELDTERGGSAKSPTNLQRESRDIRPSDMSKA